MILCVGAPPFFTVHGEESQAPLPVTVIVDVFIDHPEGSALHLHASWLSALLQSRWWCAGPDKQSYTVTADAIS